jgi:hypothetical protein
MHYYKPVFLPETILKRMQFGQSYLELEGVHSNQQIKCVLIFMRFLYYLTISIGKVINKLYVLI